MTTIAKEPSWPPPGEWPSAGPELDALVAHNVMGWAYDTQLPGEPLFWQTGPGTFTAVDNWRPSTSIEDAMAVLCRAREIGSGMFSIYDANAYQVKLGRKDGHWILAPGDTISEAICYSALALVRAESQPSR